MSDQLSAGQLVELTIESVAYRGAGVARTGGQVVFVPGTIAGEGVSARITRLHKRFAEAELVSIEQSSEGRQPSDCQVPEQPDLQVPGCVYAHMLPATEREAKQQQVRDFLVREALCEQDALQPMAPSPSTLHYRNKIVLHVGRDAEGTALGYVADDKRSIIDLPACPLAQAAINARLTEIRADAAFNARLHAHDRLTLRHTAQDGVVEWWDRPDPMAPPLHEATPMGILTVPRDAFYQVNPPVADALREQVIDWLKACSPTAVLDLYCGVGVFALAAASLGIERVVAGDRNAPAIDAARANADRLGLKVRFLATDVGSVVRTQLPKLPAEGTVVLLDPPRTGLDDAVRRVLCERKPQTLIHIACAPDRLARDLRPLLAAGYRVRAVRPFDMFPRTAAIETAVLLSRT